MVGLHPLASDIMYNVPDSLQLLLLYILYDSCHCTVDTMCTDLSDLTIRLILRYN